MNKRIQYLDGLRGIAIISVVFFHAYSRWGGIEPFVQNRFFNSAFSFGWLGVNLFFAISGYVIYMSVTNLNNFVMFSLARYLRLAPAMLIASILIYSTSDLIPDRPIGNSNLIDFLPSLTFLGPGLLSKITGLDIKSLDGAFWSLYVEVKFYFVVAFTFFFLKDRNLNLLLVIYAAWLCIIVVNYFYTDITVFSSSIKILNFLSVKYYGWFLIGIYAFKFDANRSLVNILKLMMITLSAVLTTGFGNTQTLLATSFTAAFFLLPLFFVGMKNILSSKLLLFFGFISYPLYLVHQNIVTGLAIKLYRLFPDIPSFLYPTPFIILVILIAFIIAKLEPSLRKQIKRFLPNRIFGFDVLRHN